MTVFKNIDRFRFNICNKVAETCLGSHPRHGCPEVIPPPACKGTPSLARMGSQFANSFVFLASLKKPPNVYLFPEVGVRKEKPNEVTHIFFFSQPVEFPLEDNGENSADLKCKEQRLGSHREKESEKKSPGRCSCGASFEVKLI